MTVCTRVSGGLLFLLATTFALPAQQPFSLQQVLSAPYASELTAAPAGDHFAWVEDAEGHRNLWIAAARSPAHQLTLFDKDDGLDLFSLTWSPDGSVIAFTRSTEDGPDEKPSNPAHIQQILQPQIWLAPVDGPVPAAPAVRGQNPLFSRDGHTLFFIRDHAIWSLPLSPRGVPTQLVFDRGRASSLTLSPDGNLLAFVSVRGNGQREHSYLALFDLRTHVLTFPAPSTDNDSAPAFSRDGKQLAWLRSPFVTAPEFAANRTSANPWSIQLLDIASGQSHAAFIAAPNVPGSVLPHMSSGEPRLLWSINNHILFASEADGWVHLYSLDPAHTDHAPLLLTEGPFEVEDPALSSDGRILVFASNQSMRDPLDVDRRHIWRMNLDADPAPVEITRGAGIEVHPVFSSAGNLAALVSDARGPMHAAFINSRGDMQPMHANALPAGYPTAQFTAPQQVLFPSQDKLFTLHGQVFFPPHFNPQSRHAAILFFHGGPHRQMLLGYPGMDYYSNAYAMNQYLASRGFIVLSVNYRCGIGYGIVFRDCENSGAAGAAEYNDVLGAVSYLRSSSYVDPARVGIWGGSYGGYLTALALARNSDLFAAGVDFHGVHEWAREDNATADWLRGSLAEQERIAAIAHASSPIADVARWHSPVLFIHGDDDPDVAYQQTPRLADALRARGVSVDELIFPDEVHDFILYRDWLNSYQHAAAFFERTLHPER
ncbi:MAG TPA: prolyl oligopeptidase family serine peptidase [Acidobacteriaceae bacterium]|nr:prolyl oligopeptidase family serine peptidase [Acidobacteriaceae bacterium]